MKQDPPGTLSSSAVFQQTEIGNIRDEIGIPCSMTLNFLSFPAEVTILAAESIRENKSVIENKIEIAKSVDHDRRVRQCHESRWLITLRVEMLTPRIERRRKHTALLPFKSLLSPSFLPNRGSATPFYNINELLEEVARGQGLILRGNFTDVSITTPPCTQHVDECSHGAFAFPRAQRNCS